jgi:iron complex transport system substrate-binding protein
MELKYIVVIAIALIIGIAIGYIPSVVAPRPIETVTHVIRATYTSPAIVTVTTTVTTVKEVRQTITATVTTPYTVARELKITVTSIQPTTIAVSWPRKIVDALGREIVFDIPPKRIVSTIPSITENIFALGLGDKVVGVDQYSNHPQEVAQLVSEGKITVVGGPWTLDIEKIATLKPDVVFMCRGVKPHETRFAPKLEELGIKTFFLTCNAIRNQYDIYTDLRLIAQIFDIEQKAEDVIRDIQMKIDDIANKIADSKKPKVLQLIGPPSWGLYSVGGDTFIHWIIEVAGGSNIASSYSGWPQLSYEYIISKDPDIIVITAHGIDPKAVYEEISASPLANTSAWRNKDVYLLTGDANDVLSRPSVRVVEALEILAHIIHPEIFGEIQRSDVTKIKDVELLSATAITNPWKPIY